jgi:phenylacetate-CoA ligase
MLDPQFAQSATPKQPHMTLQAWQDFLTTPFSTILERQQMVNPEAQFLARFQEMSATVPAYQLFLQQHGINPTTIKTLADFQTLPLITKENYLHQYDLAQMCRHGQLEPCDMIAVSSGSTGQPSFWPRSLSDELQIATRFEQIFHDSFQADRRHTLAVVCFALGTWVGGMYTANCCRHVASKGYPITVITPGNNAAEIFRVLRVLAPSFEQVVLLGYPPFLKDIIDRGIADGIDWAAYNVKLVMAGEVFSEEWRSLVGQRLGSTDMTYDSASLYGTADAGVLGNETPLSITIRRWLAEHPHIARSLFGESRLPTLVQYDPLSRFFEVQDGTLLFSGDNGIPLIRYHISDQGGLIPYETMLEFLATHDFNPIVNLTNTRGIHALPFVYVFGRSHFTVSYFGANIYPENVTVGLEQPPICNWVTGKFVLQVKQGEDLNGVLAIAVELAPGIEADETKQERIAITIRDQVRRLNSEFTNYVPDTYQTPRITLCPTGDPEYFPIGVKHRYTRSAT